MMMIVALPILAIHWVIIKKEKDTSVVKE